jgi:ribosomal protein S18 acetylase RimI-like enzyme
MDDVTYRLFTLADYDEVYSLWTATEGIGLSTADTPDRIAIYLERNPGLSFVAKARGEVIGAVLCGTDGRRGYLHHLAVRLDWRGKGVGGELVKRCLAGLLQAGIDRCHLFVYKKNESGRAFWVHQGWRERLDLMIASIDV